MAKSSPLSGRIGPRFGGRGARKRTRIFAGLTSLLIVTYFGTTYAASISLGNGPLEFGQGQRHALACDQDGISTAIEENWNPSTFYFKADKVILTGVDNRSRVDQVLDPGCRDVIIKVRLFGSDGELNIGSGEDPTFISFKMDSESAYDLVGVTNVLLGGNFLDNSRVEITLPLPIDASTIVGIGLETELPVSP